MKKLFALVIAVAMIVTVFAVSASAAEAKYILVYLANSQAGGVGGGIQEKDLVDGQEVEVKDCTYSNQAPTLNFSHWTDIEGNKYYPGDTFIVKAANANALKRITLTAQWEYVPGVHVTYDKNTDDPACFGQLHGNKSGELPKGSQYVVSGITSPICGLTYEYHKLVEWNTAPDGSGDGYQPGEVMVVNDETTLYAIWENIEQEVVFCSVTFDANGGEGEMTPETDIPSGGSIMAPFCDYTYDGYMFAGWNTAADGSGEMYEEWDDITVVSDLTLYAMWEESDAWDYNPEDGELGNIAIAVAISTLALGALAITAKKKD